MKRISIFFACFLMVFLLCPACTVALHETSPAAEGQSASPAPDANGGGVTSPLPSSRKPDPAKPYSEHGFQLLEAAFTEPSGPMPEGEFLLILNEVPQGAGVFSEETERILGFSALFEVDEPAEGTLRFVVTREGDASESYEHLTYAAFGAGGLNTLTLYTKTKRPLSGTYTLQWYIDNCLVYQGSVTK